MQLRYFVEYGTGSQHAGEIEKKIVSYAAYSQSAACAAIWEKMPGVLLACESASQEASYARRIASLGAEIRTPVNVLLTHKALWQKRGLLGPIWRAPGMTTPAWQERATCWGAENPRLMQMRRELLARQKR